MCMMKAPKPITPPPPPAPPPVLEQTAPKSAGASSSKAKRQRQGLSQYKAPSATPPSTKLGGIPKKKGTGL